MHEKRLFSVSPSKTITMSYHGLGARFPHGLEANRTMHTCRVTPDIWRVVAV